MSSLTDVYRLNGAFKNAFGSVLPPDVIFFRNGCDICGFFTR